MIKLFKKLSVILFVLFFALSAWADSALQVDFLLAGYRHPTTDKVLSDGYVLTYLDGTSTLSAIWTDKDKGGSATNPFPLDSSGKAEVFGDNIYKFEIYDGDPFGSGVLIETLNGLEYLPIEDSVDTSFIIDHKNNKTHIVYEHVGILRSSTLVPFEGQKVSTLGSVSAGDHGPGDWRWDPASTETDNRGTIVKVNSIVTGRWLRIYSGPLNPLWFGAVGDGIANDTLEIQAMADVGGDIWSPFGFVYYCTTRIFMTDVPVSITGGKYLFDTSGGFVYSTVNDYDTVEFNGVSIISAKAAGGTALDITFPVTNDPIRKDIKLDVAIYGSDVGGADTHYFDGGVAIHNGHNSNIKGIKARGGGASTTNMAFGLSFDGTASDILVDDAMIRYVDDGIISNDGIDNLRISNSFIINAVTCVDFNNIAPVYGAVLTVTDSYLEPVGTGVRGSDIIALTLDKVFFQKNVASTWIGVDLNTTGADIAESHITNCDFGNNLGTGSWTGVNAQNTQGVIMTENTFDSSSGTSIVLGANAKNNVVKNNYNVQSNGFITNVSRTNWIKDNISFPNRLNTPGADLDTENPPDVKIGQGNGHGGVYNLFNPSGVAKNVTNFTGGVIFQIIHVRISGNNITLVNGATLDLQGGINYAPTIGAIITLQAWDNAGGGTVWRELARRT